MTNQELQDMVSDLQKQLNLAKLELQNSNLKAERSYCMLSRCFAIEDYGELWDLEAEVRRWI